MDGLLKFITCGSVDDGKSTLIGHMLYDAKLLFTDQEKALELDSRVGNRDGKLDYSLLLDGLLAEREQGITIDVAYRYFSTEKRSFIVADTPGHEEYARNMAVGASFADLAVILIDATKGILAQTRRHAGICGLMGIRHFLFAVNKMDLVHYRESEYKKIEKEIKKLAIDLDLADVTVIPVSATEGDNVTRRSEPMKWYQGPTLLGYLEEVNTGAGTEEGFVMPVQRVCRPNHTFRGFQGQVLAGQISEGDMVTVLPSRETAKVQSLLLADRKAETVEKGNPVTIQLNKEIDVSRGCVFVSGTKLKVSNMFSASILWMDDTELVQGKNFLIKIGTKTLPATVMKIKYKIDVNTGAHVQAESITKNEIAFCEISVGSKIVFDEFKDNKDLGSMILIDRITNMTSACGVVVHEMNRDNNLTWHDMDITKELREGQMNQKALTIWMTGLSGSGKSTVANALEKKLFSMGKHTMILDGDNVRMGLNKNLGFGEKDRIENIRRIAEVSKLMNDAGLIVLTAFISPYRKDRRKAKEIIGDNFIEVYVATPLEECEKRDVKGLYKAAREGKIFDFTGISSPYEAPEYPDVVVGENGQSVEECVDAILEGLKDYFDN